MMANLIFREYLWDRDKVLNLANSILEAHFSEEKKPDVDEQALREKHSELERLHRKCDTLIEMRAEGDLTREAFKQKKAQAESEILRLESEIHEMETALSADPEPVKDYTEKLEVLRYALEQYTTPDEEDVPPSVIEAFVEKIVVSKDGYDWYLRFSGDPNDPLHCTTEGKRRSTTTITVSNGQTSITAPALHRPRLRKAKDPAFSESPLMQLPPHPKRRELFSPDNVRGIADPRRNERANDRADRRACESHRRENDPLKLFHFFLPTRNAVQTHGVSRKERGEEGKKQGMLYRNSY